MTDDPRQILAEAGVECEELNRYIHYAHAEWDDEDLMDVGPFAPDVFLALARLVAKYKEQAAFLLSAFGDVLEHHAASSCHGDEETERMREVLATANRFINRFIIHDGEARPYSVREGQLLLEKAEQLVAKYERDK